MGPEDFSIRHIFDTETNSWRYSIVDTISHLVSTSDARNYWKVLKNRLKKGDNQLVTACNQLKMRSSDGKSYLTDTADADTLTEIIRVASPTKVTRLRAWLSLIEREKPSVHDEKSPSGETGYPQENVGAEENVDGTLPLDLCDFDDALVVKAFVAGVEPDRLSLTITPHSLTIAGRRESMPLHTSGHHTRQELFWGGFSREVTLPSEIDIGNVRAECKKGLLIITLPKINLSRTINLKIKSIR